MRRILLLLTVAAVVFIVLNRDRLYIWDPLGHVERNGVRQTGAKVFINAANDVLVQTRSASSGTMQQFMVQNWNRLPGLPSEMKCLQGLACLAEADHAPMVPMPGSTGAPLATSTLATMTSREVSFGDKTGTTVKVRLR